MSKIFSVSNSEELMNALASATGGDTIELASGDYGSLTLIDGSSSFDVRFNSEVTIRSADSEQPASFSGMDLRGVSNLTFDGLVFDYEFDAGDPIWQKPFQVGYGSSDISIKNSIFDGDLASGISEVDDGYGYAIGLSVRDASNISIDNNEFFNWHRGALYSQTDNLSVVNNEVYAIRSDGFDFVEVKHVLIEGNHIHDFRGSPDSTDHRDMIQFWTDGTASPTTDVVIRNNTLDIGDGTYTQSIFMRNGEVDSGRAGVEMYYENVLIENNTIYNGHTHGITVGETDGLTIRNNSLLQASGDENDLSGDISIPKINLNSASTSVIVDGNITSAINGHSNQSDWTISGNALLHPSDYLEQFVTSTFDAENGTHAYILLPDSKIEQLGAGSPSVLFPDAPDTLTPLFQVHSDASSSHSLIFDASLTVGPLGLVSDSDAQFLWTFEDGSTASGRVVKHTFVEPGYHDVTLTVVAKDGTTAKAGFTAGISGDRLVQFDAQSGQFETLAFGEENSLESDATTLTQTADGSALKLGGDGIKASVSNSELAGFFGTDAFEMSMSLKADSPDSWGEVANVHMSFYASVDRSGNFVATLFLDDGSRMNVTSQGINITDGNVHDITVRFDGAAGFAEIMIDDKLVASENVSGALGGTARDLMFGNPWANQKFDGELSAFSLNADSFDFPIYDGETVPVSSMQTSTSQEDAVTETAPEAGTIADSPDNTATETASEEDPVDTSVETVAPDLTEPEDPTPAPEEDSGALQPLLLDGYELDIAGITTSNTERLHDNAYVTETQTGSAVVMDGKKDYVSIGRLEEFEASEEIAFSVDFVNKDTDGSRDILVWNHMKLGLTLEKDGLRVHANNTDSHFSTGFLIEGLGLNDGGRHTATVMVDSAEDRLQVIVDDVLVLDERDTDFDFVGAGGYEWGWTLGTPWNRWFEGEVHDFQVSDNFEFLDTTSDDGMPLA